MRVLLAVALTLSVSMLADEKENKKDAGSTASATCNGMPTDAQLRTLMIQAASSAGAVGGLFGGTRMWASVVNRDGEVCATNTSTSDPSQVWPGSQAIA